MSREHGTRAMYFVERCRCRPCKDACSEYERMRTRQVMYGRWEPYVDADPVREHVRVLQASGMGWKRIARTAGIGESTMWKLLYGDRARFDGPSKRCRPSTAEKILAVQPSPDLLADGAFIDADMTWRRVHSLMALGWSRSWIATQLAGRPVPSLQFKPKQITVRNARAVKALYDRVGDERAPLSPSSSRAVNEAKRNGWPRPAEWDDDGRDLPADDGPDIDLIAVEKAMRGEHVPELTRVERIEAVRRMAAAGRTRTQISKALDMNGSRVAQILDRLEVAS